MNSIKIDTQLAAKLLKEFVDEEMSVEYHKSSLLIKGKVKKIITYPYTLAVKIEKIENSQVHLHLNVIDVKVIKVILDILVVFFNNTIEEKINSKYPGIAKLNYPELLLDLSAIKIQKNIPLTDLITVKNIILGNEIVIEFE